MRPQCKRFLPRPYQDKAVREVLTLYKGGARKMLLHLPTGSGKTIIATLIIERLLPLIDSGKVLFIAHRRELLDQTAEKLKQHLPGLAISIDQGERRADPAAQVIIASIQSLSKRKDAYRPDLFSVIVCDECHRALAPSWVEVIEHFHDERDGDALLLGMTATPRRTDGRSALDVFDLVAYEIAKPELQDLGYLVPIQYWGVKAALSLDQVKRSAGDFQVGALSAVMDTPHVRALTLRAWESKANGRKTLVFCASVRHAHRLAADFASRGHRAEVLDGRTKNRGEILDRFRRGDVDLLLNYGVLTEGFDDPSIQCVLLARPTTSPLVYNQCLGRGLRPAPNKTYCTVIDIIDRSTHQLQYGASQLADLPRGWNSRGRDPFRESRAISQIKVTDPEAFLAVKRATSLEEIQDLLMALPTEVVIAGLDGEPVPRYDAVATSCTEAQAKSLVRDLLKQAGAPVIKTILSPPSDGKRGRIEITLLQAEVNNERYQYLRWHMERATGWHTTYAEPTQRTRRLNLRALLRSTLPEGYRIKGFDYDEAANRIVVHVPGLPSEVLEQICTAFAAASGIDLEIQGQLSFGFF
ncbi:MAG: DEAD/DEAH box helicase [Chromatiaceae bacterium]